jgi:hypothetical protein
MPMPSNKDLEQKLDNLHLLAIEKFAIITTKTDGINTRLDTLNGKVSDHEKRLQDSALDRNGMHAEIGAVRAQKTVPTWVAVVLPIFTALVIYFLTK